MPVAASSSPASTLTFQEVLVRWGLAYLERWGSAMPARQREVLAKILSCRTPRRGGELWLCPAGHHFQYVYHSCNDRHCPQCGQTEAQEWLDRQSQRLLLPVDYFLVTLPEGRLRWTYRDSQTHQVRHLDLEPNELIRRFLQHVLPAGYSRVRYFGWLAPAARQKANRVRALLGQRPQLSAAEQAAWQVPEEDGQSLAAEEVSVERPPRLCPHCQLPLIRHATWFAGRPPPWPPILRARAPP